MKAQDYNISSEKFVFHKTDGNLHDNKLETKPVTYFQDALKRFARNKASIGAFVIIVVLLLFAVIAPITSPYTVSYTDGYYKFTLPKNQLFYDLGIPFWDGGTNKEVNKATFEQYRGIQEEIGRDVFMSEPEIVKEKYMGKTRELYRFRLDTYNAVGIQYVRLSTAQYQDLQKYQDETGIQVIYPITDVLLRPEAEQDKTNANIWYATKLGAGRKTEIVYDESGNFISIYKANDGKDMYTSKMYAEGSEKLYNYAEKMDGDLWNIRVDYREYYVYNHYKAGDGITEPSFLLGTTDAGQDIFTCLASGARFSFILAFIVAAVNLFVGAIYGAIEGYYGGKTDLLMERFVELLSSIPFMIVITLLKYHLNASHILILFISFFLTGWTGMAGRTANLFDLQDHGIRVAVEPDGLDLLHHAGAFALMPEVLAATAPVMGLTRGEGGLPGIFVHPGEHEHFAGGRILRHSGDKATGLGKVRREISRSIEHRSSSFSDRLAIWRSLQRGVRG